MNLIFVQQKLSFLMPQLVAGVAGLVQIYLSRPRFFSVMRAWSPFTATAVRANFEYYHFAR